jgi:hypothetical protein
MLDRLAIVTAAVLRRSLGSRHWQNGQPYIIPPRGDWHGIFSSDPL